MTARSRALIAVTVGLTTAACALGPTARSASALDVKPICTAAGLLSGIAGKACTLATHARAIAKAGKKALGGHLVGAAKTLLGGDGSSPSTASTASTALGLAAIGAWVLGGATIALHETAKVLSDTTGPQLASTWFSAAYWRIAGLGAVLTLPFLFAAAVQALLRSDLALLTRAALGYLPLSLLAVSIAAPVTMLLLAASDELSAIVGAAAGNADTHLLTESGVTLGALTILSGSPFLAFLVGLLTAAGALVLWLELLMREAAVYVIVLMLPLVFAALVWPARRVWAVRAVELLVALILSKFAIVAVLALGGEALSHGAGHSVTGSLAGVVLLLMGAFAPWALLRLVPLAELASGAAGSLRAEGRAIGGPISSASAVASWADERSAEGWAADVTSVMRRQAEVTPSPGPAPGGAGVDRPGLAELAPSAPGDTEPPADDGGSGGGPGGGALDRLDNGAAGGSAAGDGPAGGGALSGLDGSEPGATGEAHGNDGAGGPDAGPDGLLDAGALTARAGSHSLDRHPGGGPGAGGPGVGGPGVGGADHGDVSDIGATHGPPPGGAVGDDRAASRRERFRDWDEMWQAQDEQWRPFVYPFDHESPPDPPWPPDNAGNLGGTAAEQETQGPEQAPEDGWL